MLSWPSENRLVLPVSFALLENIKIYFEENLPNDALDLLNDLLVYGKRTTAPRGSRRNSVLPPPSYLDLVSTLPIHPRYTTHSKSRDDHHSAILALRYLQLLPALISIKDSGLTHAFRFDEARSAERWERGTKRKARVALEGSQTVGFDDDVINHPIARDGIWTQARDFWHALGWAMNCAVWHRRRWEHWQLWLEFMVSVMGRDIEERIALRDAGEGEGGRLEESMLGRFLLLHEPGDGREMWKRAAKAVFADGEERAINEFPPVWRDETKEPKNDEMEVYRAPSIYRDDKDPSATWLRHTGPGVRELRIRLMALLLQICRETPSTSSLSPASLSDLLASHITHLPFPVYTDLLRAEPRDSLPAAALSTLTQIIINWLIDHAAPANPEPNEAPTQHTLATCYLPFAANTSSLEDNARLSWALEVMLRMYFDAHPDTRPSSEMVYAMDLGTAVRENRIEGAKTRKGAKGEEDEMFKNEMLESTWRMRILVEAVEGAMEGKNKRAAEDVESVQSVESVEEVVVDRNDLVARAKRRADLLAEWEALD